MPFLALLSFSRLLKTALGPQAETTKVSITGGLKMQLEKIRDTKVCPGHLLRCRVVSLTVEHLDINIIVSQRTLAVRKAFESQTTQKHHRVFGQ
jgi:hypothetical protein